MGEIHHNSQVYKKIENTSGLNIWAKNSIPRKDGVVLIVFFLLNILNYIILLFFLLFVSYILEGVKVSPAGVPCGGVFLRANLLWLGFCVYFPRREKSALCCGDSLLNKI